jgi:hypothetical protein
MLGLLGSAGSPAKTVSERSTTRKWWIRRRCVAAYERIRRGERYSSSRSWRLFLECVGADFCADGGPQDDVKGDAICFQTVVLTRTRTGASLNSIGYRASGDQEHQE